MSNNKRIVIVDDNTSLMTFISNIFQSMNIHVDTISNADDAVQFFGSLECDPYAVILDYAIGVVNSDEIAKLIRQKSPDTIIVVVSGCPPSDICKIQSLVDQKTVDSFLQKPFAFPELLKHLRL